MAMNTMSGIAIERRDNLGLDLCVMGLASQI